jgi:hypothetical protein
MRATDTPQSLDTLIRFAIKHRRLIDVGYKGAPRVAEPHDYGVQNGVERLFVYQLRGPVRSSRLNPTGWRLLDTLKIDRCVVLEATFPGSRGRSHRNHLAWDVLYARVV